MQKTILAADTDSAGDMRLRVQSAKGPVILIAVVLTLFTTSMTALAQEDEADGPLKKAVRKSFPQYTLSLATVTSNNLKLFENDLFSVSFEDLDYYSSLQIEIAGLPEIPKVSISAFVRDPYRFCPALENVALPRTSLNMEPVIGKYYWEW